jgi:WD40 repeat protein
MVNKSYCLPSLVTMVRLMDCNSSIAANVMCVRWSNGQGKHLASGGDDKCILIWEQDTNAEQRSIPFGSIDGVANIENWRVLRMLRGHESDVLDLAWSPDNDYIVSCSLDRYVAVWDAKTFGTFYIGKLTSKNCCVNFLDITTL